MPKKSGIDWWTVGLSFAGGVVVGVLGAAAAGVGAPPRSVFEQEEDRVAQRGFGRHLGSPKRKHGQRRWGSWSRRGSGSFPLWSR
jgi:hypothetical protein